MAGFRRKEKPVEWRVNVPVHVALRFEQLIMDQLRGKPTYGARSHIITQLLVEYLDKLETSKCQTPPSPLPPLSTQPK